MPSASAVFRLMTSSYFVGSSTGMSPGLAPLRILSPDDPIDKVASRRYPLMMYTVGLKILKNKLSEYVRLAADGETVVITDRGRAVAEIVPHRRQQNESFVERGVREGWLTPAKRPFQPLPPRKPIPGLTLEQLLADLDRDREDRW
jgi:prevent-host-death family protein